jgi:hypothetical protein
MAKEREGTMVLLVTRWQRSYMNQATPRQQLYERLDEDLTHILDEGWLLILTRVVQHVA